MAVRIYGKKLNDLEDTDIGSWSNFEKDATVEDMKGRSHNPMCWEFGDTIGDFPRSNDEYLRRAQAAIDAGNFFPDENARVWMLACGLRPQGSPKKTVVKGKEWCPLEVHRVREFDPIAAWEATKAASKGF
jgi:hypothetical protein